jgi:hypothetical protein
MQPPSPLVALFTLLAKKATFQHFSVRLASHPVSKFASLGAHPALGLLLVGYPTSKASSTHQYTPCS